MTISVEGKLEQELYELLISEIEICLEALEFSENKDNALDAWNYNRMVLLQAIIRQYPQSHEVDKAILLKLDNKIKQLL
jgi:hypothetical protein